MTDSRKVLLAIAFILFSIIVIGLFVLATSPAESVSLTLSYAAGLSMIFLPCTFPLVFVIVPLTMAKGHGHGLAMAVLFGAGLTITIGIYAVAVAVLGQYFGLDIFTRGMFTVAGVAAYIFGLSELGIIKLHVPGLHGVRYKWILERGDYLKSFFLGLLLGNAGIGCPNPAFYTLLIYIATLGSIETGAALGIVHGIGRATPLIFIAIAAILGFQATKVLSRRILLVKTLTGWVLLFLGAFLTGYGLFGMEWWEDSIFHVGWNEFIFSLAPALAEVPGHPVAVGVFQAPFWAGWVWLLLLFVIPSLVWLLRKEVSVAHG